MSKVECPYTFPHTSRAEKVDYICGLGGYVRTNARYPVSFNVYAAGADTDFDTLWAKILEDHASANEDVGDPAFVTAAREAYSATDDWFSVGLSEARESVFDGDTYFMLWGDEKPRDIKLGFHGRCSKHLVIEEFEGGSLSGLSPQELRALLLLQYDGESDAVTSSVLMDGYRWEMSDAWVDTFYRYCRQCEVDFTPDKAAREVEDCAAFRLYCNAEVEYEEAVAEAEAKAELYAHAERVMQYMTERPALSEASPKNYVEATGSLRVLCAAAGIAHEKITELMG